MTTATTTNAGTAPTGGPCVLVRITFDESASNMLYHYWAPEAWALRAGDKLYVRVPSVGRQIRKIVTVHDVLDPEHPRYTATWKLAAGKIRTAPTNLDPLTPEQRDSWNVMNIAIPTPPFKQDTAMIKIEHTTFVDGNPIEAHSNDQLIEKISNAENELKRLDAIEHKPIALRKKIEELQSGIDFIVKYMDDKEPKPDPAAAS